MRIMTFSRKIIWLLSVYFASFTQVWAVEFDAQVERVFWRYQEYAKDVTGFANSLPSRAEGNGGLVKLRVSTERDQDWFLGLSAAMLDSSSWANEAWGTTQVNELTIQQQDVRLDMQYRMLGARFGLWISERVHKQQRRNFFLNGVATAVAGEPIEEKIVSDWVGLSLTSVGGNVDQFEARIDAGVPLNVKVTNPLFTKPFTKQDGYRTGIHLRWTLPESEVWVSGLNLTLRYEYQELGGENTVSNGFWPYNRWQMISTGLMYAW